MNCVTCKKRNDQRQSSNTKFSRSDGTEAPRALTNLVISYNRQSLEELDDLDFAHKIFFACLDQLNTTEMCQILAGEKISNYRILTANVCALLSVANDACIMITLINDLPDNKYTPLIEAMRTNIDDHLPDQSSFLKMTSNILSFLWNLADQTIAVPSLVRAGLPDSLARWLSRAHELSTDICDNFVNIAHNVARHDEGNDALNRHGALKILKRAQTAAGIKESEDGSLTAAMTLALLSTPEQIRNDPTNWKDTLDQLLQITINIAANTSPSALASPTFHISEPLIVLVRLFVHDESLHYVLTEAKTDPSSSVSSTIQLFSDLLLRFRLDKKSDSNSEQRDQLTFIALLNIFWSISFHIQYQDELKSHTEILSLVRTLSQDNDFILLNQYVPRSLQSLKKAADGILFNLGEVDIQLQTVNNSGTTLKPLIMLSYSHANQSMCEQILKLLDQKSDVYDVWVDLRYCQGSDDVWEKIAQGVKKAHVILCLVSNEYCESKSCRQEITYALDKLNKPVVPVYLEKPNVSEWLEIRIASKKYIRFQKLDEQQLDNRKVDELLTTIQATISQDVLSNNTTAMQSSSISPELLSTTDLHVSSSQKPVITWTSQDIVNWFDENDISKKIYDLYEFQTGMQLLMYAECLHDDWKEQFERYAPRYAKKYDTDELTEHEFIKFVSAIRQLPLLQNKSNKKRNRKKFFTCTVS